MIAILTENDYYDDYYYSYDCHKKKKGNLC